MVNKRAQISLFLLVGIVVIVGFILIFHLKSSGPSEVNFNKIQSDAIKDYVDSCVELTAKHAVITLGLQGGFIGIPNDVKLLTFKQSPPINVVYLYDYDNYVGNQYSKLQSLDAWQNELSDYINKNLEVCINNFKPFKLQGYDITAGKPNANVKIRDRDIVVNLDYPLVIKKGNTQEKLNDFQVRVGIDLKEVHQQVENILNAIYSSDNNPDLGAAIALCKERTSLGKFCPQQSVNFDFDIDRVLDKDISFNYDHVDPKETTTTMKKTTTLWVVKTKFKTNELFYFVFAARHKYQKITPH